MKRYGLFQIFGELRIFLCNYFIAYLPSHHIRLFYYKNVMRFKIEKGSSIHLGCKFSCTKNFSLGIDSTINQNCYLDNRGGIHIQNHVSIAHRVAIITADHDVTSKWFKGREIPVYIQDYGFIGFGATILGGVIISLGSMVVTCSLVIKTTKPCSLNYGIP